MDHPAFFEVLRAERPRLNEAFAATRRKFPALTEANFKTFLMERVAPLARVAQERAPGRVGEVVLAAYEVGLELVGQSLAGPTARHPDVNGAFELVFPACIALVSQKPLPVLAALSNAAHHIATTPGARCSWWLAELARTGPKAANVDELLRVGQVLAWRAGLAHFRDGALEACFQLPEPLARAALGASEAGSLDELRFRLERDPWFDPAQPHKNPSARWVGCFRGFGGLFQEPPRVSETRGHLLVESGSNAWVLTADAHGATFHRATDGEVATKQVQGLAAALHYDDGTIRLHGRPLPLIARGVPTSAASLSHTLALTFATTHELALCALEAPP